MTRIASPCRVVNWLRKGKVGPRPDCVCEAHNEPPELKAEDLESLPFDEVAAAQGVIFRNEETRKHVAAALSHCIECGYSGHFHREGCSKGPR